MSADRSEVPGTGAEAGARDANPTRGAPETGAKDTVLVVDDEARIRRLLEMALGDAGYRVLLAGSSEEADLFMEKEVVDLVLTDLTLPGRSGLELLSRLRAQGIETPVILITAFGTVETAVEAMKLGAFDYVIKPFRTEEIEALVARALQLTRAERENTYFRELSEASFEGITARSPAMAAVIRTIERVAPTPSTVLITGETGVGKELVARALHARSPRKDQLFVPLNCAAIPPDLLEAELFGVTRGAFTGATQDRPGKFELADGGTLFLDEIGDMPHSMQAKLLRVLQEGSVERLGANRTRKVDVRVVSATHRNLEAMVESGEFRQDLFYRLNVVPIHVPPLRERTEDIRPIATALAEAHSRRLGRRARLSEPLLRRLERHPWPGNVRELNNILERAVLLAESDALTEVDLPDPRRPLGEGTSAHPWTRSRSEGSRPGSPPERGPAPASTGGSPPARPVPLKAAVRRAEKDAILQALEWTGDNKTRAAEVLGVSVRTLWYKIRNLGLGNHGEARRDTEPDLE